MPQPITSLLRTRRFWFGAFALLALSSAGIVQAKEQASREDRNVRIVETKSANGGTTISAQLTNCTEATISLSLTLENASTSCPVPLVVDAAGRKSFELVTVRADDKRRPWTYRLQYRWKPGRRGEVKASTFAYLLPYREETHEVIQADFGKFSHQEGSGDEHAIDWDMPVGTPVLAARAGTVVGLRTDSDVGGNDVKFKHAYNYVIIRHEDGTFGEYGHLKTGGVAVKLGQQLKAQERLGLSGSTGFSSRPHLHFSVFQTIDGESRRTIPIQFKTAEGQIEALKEGKTY